MFKWINKKRNKKGFTLVELVVVIAILGILAAIAVPKFIGSQDRAKEKAHEANKATLRSAANIAVAEFGSPKAEVTWTLGKAGDDVADTILTTPESETNIVGKNYVDKWPISPYTGSTAYRVIIAKDTGEITVEDGDK